jgi:hypothetical protein
MKTHARLFRCERIICVRNKEVCAAHVRQWKKVKDRPLSAAAATSAISLLLLFQFERGGTLEQERKRAHLCVWKSINGTWVKKTSERYTLHKLILNLCKSAHRIYSKSDSGGGECIFWEMEPVLAESRSSFGEIHYHFRARWWCVVPARRPDQLPPPNTPPAFPLFCSLL